LNDIFYYDYYISLKEIIDKTSEFVAKNGAAFEELVIKAESNNPKFSFLKKDDPFRSYYDSKIVEFKEGSRRIYIYYDLLATE
jgi:hypothetical protein